MFIYGQKPGRSKSSILHKVLQYSFCSSNSPAYGRGSTMRDGTEHLKTDGERKMGFISLKLLDCFSCKFKMKCFALLWCRTVPLEATPRPVCYLKQPMRDDKFFFFLKIQLHRNTGLDKTSWIIKFLSFGRCLKPTKCVFHSLKTVTKLRSLL